jgi:putative ABC transport system permease protein
LQLVTRQAVWGLVASALIVAITAVAARPLLHLCERPLVRAGALAGPDARFAIAMLVQSPRRASLTIGMIGVGVATVLWLGIIAESFERTVVESLTPALSGDLSISSVHLTSGFIEEGVDESVADELRAVPGVAALSRQRIVDWPFRNGMIALNAHEPNYFATGAFGLYPLVGERLADAWGAVARGEAAVMSSSFAFNTGARVGDVITLESPSGPVPLRLAGVVNDFTAPGGTLELSRDVYVRFSNDRRLTRVYLNAAPDTARDTLRAEIARRLGRKYALKILSAGELQDHFAGQVRRGFAGFDFLRELVLVLLLVGMSDTLGAGVVERTRELGAIRALGVRPRRVARVVVLEALVLALLGLALALPAGFGLGVLWVKAAFPNLLGWVLDVHVPYARAAGVVALTLGACLLAAVLPARRAAALRPALALRAE